MIDAIDDDEFLKEIAAVLKKWQQENGDTRCLACEKRQELESKITLLRLDNKHLRSKL